MIRNQQKVCFYVCLFVVNADLEQQEAGQMTAVRSFFALEKDCVYITFECWLFSKPRLIPYCHLSKPRNAPSDKLSITENKST